MEVRIGLTETVLAARQFAIEAHGEQRYGARPYVVHLDAVVEILRTLEVASSGVAVDDELLIIGYLHDVVEDTPVSAGDVAARFGDGVARCVDLLSDRPGANRKERKAATYARLAGVATGHPDARALVVKAADRLANVRQCVKDENRGLLKMYVREHGAFRHAARREKIARAVWDELDGHVGYAP